MANPDDTGLPVTWAAAPEPPGPESVSAAVVVGGTVATIGIAALYPVLELAAGVVGLVDWVAGAGAGDTPSPITADVTGTQPPVQTDAGLVSCTRCDRAVPWATMSLNEHGYFCAGCGPSQPTPLVTRA